jgi:hypothetical protein
MYVACPQHDGMLYVACHIASREPLHKHLEDRAAANACSLCTFAVLGVL